MSHHAHGSPPVASRHTRRIVTAVLLPAAFATIVAMIVLWPGRVHLATGDGGSAAGVRALGTVAAVSETACPAGTPAGQRCGTAAVAITEGPGAHTKATVDLPQGPGAPELHPGDKIVLLYAPDAVPGGKPYVVTDSQRDRKSVV